MGCDDERTSERSVSAKGTAIARVLQHMCLLHVSALLIVQMFKPYILIPLDHTDPHSFKLSKRFERASSALWFPMPTSPSQWQLALAALAISTFTVRFHPKYSVNSSYVWTSISTYLLFWLLNGIWAALIYPKFFSPLRHLTHPTESSDIICTVKSVIFAYRQ